MNHPGRHRRAIFAAYLVVVGVLLLAPITVELPRPELTWFDKVIHFFLFVGVALLGFWNRPSALAIALFTAVLAGALELLQGPCRIAARDCWTSSPGRWAELAGLGWRPGWGT
jgi:hypothetical protein